MGFPLMDKFLLFDWILGSQNKNGFESTCLVPETVTERSCMASKSAACVLGGVLLISSASNILVKSGPLLNLKCLFSSNISDPVMSEGIKSGVNWMRLNERSNTSAMVDTNNVFANPGTPTNKL